MTDQALSPSLSTLVRDLERRLRTLEERKAPTFATVKSDVAALFGDVADLGTDLTAVESDITDLDTDLTAAESDIVDLETDVSALQSSALAVRTGEASRTTALTLSTSATSSGMPDVSIVAGGSGVALVTCTFDFEANVIGGGAFVGLLRVHNGAWAWRPGSAIFVPTAAGQRAVVAQTYIVPITQAGTWRFLSYANKTASSGTYKANDQHTKMSVFLID